MATVILGITDSHWSLVKPRSRKDVDYKLTQERKLQALFKLAKLIKHKDGVGASAVVHAGDLFHQPQGKLISRRLDTWIIPILKTCPVPILAIPGNHDMQGHRTDSLEDHPYGVLLHSQSITQVAWPSYVVVGDDPPIIVTGKEFTTNGPLSWLNYIKENKTLINLKMEIKEKTGKNAKVVALTHCWWGPSTGTNMGEPLIGYNELSNTGIDVLMYGHPHTLDGVISLQDDYGSQFLVGPGAFIRGTLAEHDVNREPKIMIATFEADGVFDVKLVSVPHQKASEVFDLSGHQKQKREEADHASFIRELQETLQKELSPEDILESPTAKNTDPEVVALVRQYITNARQG
jgi:predicted phosphodiesterase